MQKSLETSPCSSCCVISHHFGFDWLRKTKNDFSTQAYQHNSQTNTHLNIQMANASAASRYNLSLRKVLTEVKEKAIPFWTQKLREAAKRNDISIILDETNMGLLDEDHKAVELSWLRKEGSYNDGLFYEGIVKAVEKICKDNDGKEAFGAIKEIVLSSVTVEEANSYVMSNLARDGSKIIYKYNVNVGIGGIINHWAWTEFLEQNL